MKTMSILGIILSIAGMIISAANWYAFTEQVLSYSTITGENRPTYHEFSSSDLGHKDESVVLLVILFAIFTFFLLYSIFTLIHIYKNEFMQKSNKAGV